MVYVCNEERSFNRMTYRLIQENNLAGDYEQSITIWLVNSLTVISPFRLISDFMNSPTIGSTFQRLYMVLLTLGLKNAGIKPHTLQKTNKRKLSLYVGHILRKE